MTPTGPLLAAQSHLCAPGFASSHTCCPFSTLSVALTRASSRSAYRCSFSFPVFPSAPFAVVFLSAARILAPLRDDARVGHSFSSGSRLSSSSYHLSYWCSYSHPSAPTPNHALQPTATLAFSFRSAALSSTGSVTAYAPAMKPGIRRAFASRRCAHTRALGSRSLSLGSLGVF